MDYPRLAKTLRILLVLALIVIFAYLANMLGDIVSERLKMEITQENANMIFGATVAAIIIYALLIALPFVPGVEIGIGLMLMFGSSMAVPVYISTVTGLSLGFLIGRLVPEKIMCQCFDFIGLTGFTRLLKEVARKPVHERLALLIERAPSRITPLLLRYRYLAIAVAFNIPGNSVIGGGGGIAFMAGTSRLFSFPMYLLAVAIGVSPVPILVLIFGPTVFG